MKNFISKNWPLGVLGVIVIFVAIYLSFLPKSTTPSFSISDQPLSDNVINCEFRVTSDFVYKSYKDAWSDTNRKVYYDTSVAPQKKQDVVTFAELSSGNPIIKGNSGDAPLEILKNDSEMLVLSERNMANDMFIYTIFKKEKVATWYKSYKIVKIPFGMLSMGYCY